MVGKVGKVGKVGQLLQGGRGEAIFNNSGDRQEEAMKERREDNQWMVRGQWMVRDERGETMGSDALSN